MAYTGLEPFGGRTNFSWTPSGGYKGLDDVRISDNTNPRYTGVGQTDLSTGKTSKPSEYGRGAGGIGSAPLSTGIQRQPFGTLSERMGSSSYGGGRSGGGVFSLGASESYLTPTMPKPTIGDMPAYNMPEMDRGRISELAELEMGAPMGRLRRGLNRSLIESRYSDNPNVRAASRKEALSGYGTGISDIRTGAHRTALSEYMPEFQAATQKAGAEYAGGINRMNLQFQSDMNEYLKTMKQTSRKVPAGQVTASGSLDMFTPEGMSAYISSVPKKRLAYAP